jgi:hypothetical protein
MPDSPRCRREVTAPGAADAATAFDALPEGR